MRRVERKAAIVEAALPLFARQGFAATTTKQLALAAGVSEALLYKHFPSKEALYREIKGLRVGVASEGWPTIDQSASPLSSTSVPSS